METEIDKAIEEIKSVIKSHSKMLDELYLSHEVNVSENYLSLVCCCKSGDTLELRVIEDNERRNLRVPMTSRDYQKQGGHRELQNKFDRHNPIAWKIEVKRKSTKSNYEIGFGGSERNWDIKSFEASFIHTFCLKK
ncbi:MAG: hypothetical protein DCF19_17720 [Pseudanabaena frigida]|uniref:Uncharacterized protein n=1 Tax=Pseudanabaena frigida TaxID=945775 RepID=A0A2W4XQR6_9CYAN|nr:MAG: hypothetical protein DCF19_17720 [Pseudanabaena frigida]